MYLQIFNFRLPSTIRKISYSDGMSSQKEQFHESGEIYRPESVIFGVPEPKLLSQYSVVQGKDLNIKV